MSTFENIKNLYEERQRFSRRVLIAGAIGVVMSLAMLLRLGQLQILDHGYYNARSYDNHIHAAPLAPVRGLIYGRHGTLLAQNLPSFDLVLTPDRISNLMATIASLQHLLPITAGDVARFRDLSRALPSYRGIPLLKSLDQREVARFAVNRYAYPGVSIRATLIRNYPQGSEFSHVLGYVGGLTAYDLRHVNPADYEGLDDIGRAGVELSHESELRGLPGSKLVEVNAFGKPLRTVKYTRAQNGDNLYLTIDARLQKVAFQALGKFNGAAVTIDPRNGDVLALVSKPGFNPALFVNGLSQKNYETLLNNPNHPLYNRALQGLYAPGSTIKPFIAFAALQAGTLIGKTRYFCPAYFTLPHSTRRFYGWYPGGMGWMNMFTSLERSSDVFFYKVAYHLGIQRIDRYIAPFGFGRRTGIDLPNELRGVLPTPKWVRRHEGHMWYPGQTLNTGVGQGDWKVTPLQLAEATARIAMHGKGFVPHIVYAVNNPRTHRTVRVQPTPLPPIRERHPHSWTNVIKGMEWAASRPRGTAYSVGHNTPYRMAAKTGTAEIISDPRNIAYVRQSSLPFKYRDDALFIAFAPVKDPKIAVAVIAEHGAEGAFAAAPVAKAMLNEYLLGSPHAPRKAA
ncbi:MAG TPA: penicillin-binding protein 2 [Nevskiaceae bacterium]|nr:penicillin-binding protein 2 [Nevskiaceae bacterium]